LSTLAVPETSTDALIVVLASGLSMMIFPPSGIGVAAVVGSEELSGEAAALADAEALAEGEPAVGDAPESTNVVVLSLPHPAIATAVTLTSRPVKNPFIDPSTRRPSLPVTPADG
jgi:hypothetical protein